MNATAKEVLRWSAVAFGGFCLYHLVGSLHFMFTRPGADWLSILLWPAPTVFLFFGPPLLVAYFCLRRQYRGALRVLAAVATLVLWGVMMGLPNRLGFFRWFAPAMSENHWLVLLGLPLSLLFLFGPFYAAGWFYRLCERWIEPYRPRLAVGSRTPNTALERTPTAGDAGSGGIVPRPQ